MSTTPTSERTPDTTKRSGRETPDTTKPAGGNLRWLWIAAVIAVIAIAGVVLWLLLSGGEGEPTLTFDGTALTYSGPETLKAGDVTFTLENTSEEEMVFYWALFNDDSITLEDSIAWMEANPDSNTGPPWIETSNWTGEAEPGEVLERAFYMFEGRNELGAFNDATGDVYIAAVIDVTGN
jgi:hypothetical protein